MLVLIFLLCNAHAGWALPGINAAIRLIQQPIINDGHVKDVILTGIVNRWEDHAYKLHILRQRIGHAWEWVFTDFGFERHSCGVDLVHHRNKIALEIKNSCQVSSTVKQGTLKALREFKDRHPTYRVIFGCINYRNIERGKSSQRGRVVIMKGTSVLDYVLGTRKEPIIERLQQAARAFVRQNL